MGSTGGGSSNNGPVITKDMIASAEVSAKQWNDYAVRWKPITDKVIAEKAGSSDEDFKERTANLQGKMRGMTNADIAQGQAKSVNPDPRNPKQSMVKTALSMTDTGARTAGGMTDVTQGASDRKAQELGTIVALGRGQQTEALGAMDSLAGASASAAMTKAKSDQQVRFANDAATVKMVGSGVKALTTAGMAYGGGGTTAALDGSQSGNSFGVLRADEGYTWTPPVYG